MIITRWIVVNFDDDRTNESEQKASIALHPKTLYI